MSPPRPLLELDPRVKPARPERTEALERVIHRLERLPLEQITIVDRALGTLLDKDATDG
jgi:hypothetical protein